MTQCLRRVVACVAISLTANVAVAVEKGDPAPDIQARSVAADGEVALHALRGKVVLVDFWASWCAPCNAAMPQLEALARALPADRFAVLGVNVDKDLAAARRAIEKRGVTYPNASDPAGRFPQKYGLKTMPTSYLVDADGTVRFVHAGFRNGDAEKLRAEIEELIAEGRAR